MFTIHDADGKHAGRRLSPDEVRKLVAYLMQIDAHDDSGVDPAARHRDDGCGCRLIGARGAGPGARAGWCATLLGVTIAAAIGARRGRGRGPKRGS